MVCCLSQLPNVISLSGVNTLHDNILILRFREMVRFKFLEHGHVIYMYIYIYIYMYSFEASDLES